LLNAPARCAVDENLLFGEVLPNLSFSVSRVVFFVFEFPYARFLSKRPLDDMEFVAIVGPDRL